jgi:SpoVK/Ycf46/Vps4 family AAA+-type ATPase
VNDIHILPRFHSEIYSHLLLNYLDLPSRPLIMGISGRPGDGKSSQLTAVLEREGVSFARIQAADLESGIAGEPGKLIERIYLDASRSVARGVPRAIVLDDIDTTLGEWEQNTGTVNHQQVLAELMHLADAPTDRNRGFLRRVPFFVTGNRLGYLYGPLRRFRRFRHFPWSPTPEETTEVVGALLNGYADASVTDVLTSSFPDQPLAFYAEVKHACIERRVAKQVSASSASIAEAVEHPERLRQKLRLDRFDASEILEVAKNLHESMLEGLKDSVTQTPGVLIDLSTPIISAKGTRRDNQPS